MRRVGARRLALLLGLLLLAVLAAPLEADADVFGPISLVSEGAAGPGRATQQADYADDPVISGDGRYVAFDGSFGGKSGVFRRDLASGEVTSVAEGDAELPSISEDGRYVSFTTTAALDQQNDTNEGPDVYVRDMADPDSGPCPPHWSEAGESCGFMLVSAARGVSQGAPEGLTYQSEDPRQFGSVASGRTAMSADGRYVAFVTTAESDLSDPATPAEPSTPALQVAVRDLDRHETKLVSVEYEGGPTERPVPTAADDNIGAVYAAHSAFPFLTGASDVWPGASISADGSTVAWMGQEIGKQAPTLGEGDLAAELPNYAEPLWRRIAGGPGEPIRRVTGGSDPTSPACAASGDCQGPFEPLRELSQPGVFPTTGDYLPRLSANGETVAFLSSAREIAGGEEFKTAESSSDLYIVDMADGLTRTQALRRLTEIASGESQDHGAIAPIIDFGVSADGSQVAFTTRRTVFPLGSPALVSPPGGEAGLAELFDVDLADDTLTRVTRGFEGGPSEEPHASGQGGALSPSFSADGGTLAFSSTASNLVYGDGNAPLPEDPNHAEDGSDAFMVSHAQFSSQAAPQYISPPPSLAGAEPAWSLGVTAVSRRDGSVLLEVQVPAAGSIRAAASAAVRVVVSSKASRAARRMHRNSSRRRRPTPTVATRRVASAAVAERASAGGLMPVALTLAPSYRTLASGRGGLSATTSVSFAAPGHRALQRRISVTFLRRPSHHGKRPVKAKRHP